ncbi:MAG: hypothetical protein H6835_00225 [Planctomycetes bacterium]|nr:hypothetical protein [Planctomycetota bacterium]
MSSPILRLAQRAFCATAAALLAGCVTYTAAPADLDTVAADVARRSGGTFTVDEAIATALRQNPELRALEAELRASDAARLVPLQAQGEWRGGPETMGLVLDPIGLLGLGTRGAQGDLADARLTQAAEQLATARWRTAVAVSEAFVVDGALAALDVPDVALDVAAFERAGLASPVAAARLRAAQARAASERAELRAMRSRNLAKLRYLLGLPRTAELACVPLREDQLRQPAGDDASLLQRPDLRLAVERYRTADAAFRVAVWEQYPMPMLGPDIMLGGGPLQWMGMLRWPLLGQGNARAAGARRDAARATLEDALLEAHRGAADADLAFTAAQATVAATAAARDAARQALVAARAALEVQGDAFDRYTEAATMTLRETMEHRLATERAARAATQRAMAFGWPLSTPDATPLATISQEAR